jgi:hypothetical protein
MKRRQGPTKRLAPNLGVDAMCPHDYVEDEGIQLEIDCTECPGAHDLANRKCLTSAINAVSSGGIPESVILKRYTHKRYRGYTVGIVSRAATELSTLNRVLAASEPALDKDCRTCKASRQNIIADLKRLLLEDPGAYLSGGQRVFEDFKRAHDNSPCGRARACIESGLSASTIYGGGG